MATRDLCHNVHPVRAISPAAAKTDNTPFVSEVIDTKGYESLTFLLSPAVNGDLTTLAIAKRELGVTDASQDARIADLIHEASDLVAQWCNRSGFGRETLRQTERLASPADALVLQRDLGQSVRDRHRCMRRGVGRCRGAPRSHTAPADCGRTTGRHGQSGR